MSIGVVGDVIPPSMLETIHLEMTLWKILKENKPSSPTSEKKSYNICCKLGMEMYVGSHL